MKYLVPVQNSGLLVIVRPQQRSSKITCILELAEAKGDEKPKLDHVRSWLKGIGTVDAEGNVTLVKKLHDWLYPEPSYTVVPERNSLR